MKLLILCIALSYSSLLLAGKEHDHEEKDHKETSKTHDDEKEHGEEKGHEDDHEEQKLPGGVTFFEDESGEFSLKEKVIQNFGIVLGAPVKTGNSIELPEEAIVRSLKETSIFVQNGDRFKSIPVKILNSSDGKVRVAAEFGNSKVVLKGNNFLKTILLSLEEGPSEGHGH